MYWCNMVKDSKGQSIVVEGRGGGRGAPTEGFFLQWKDTALNRIDRTE